VCRSKHVELLINIGIINSSTWLHLIIYLCMICALMHGIMNIKQMQNTWLFPCSTLNGKHNVLKSRYHPMDAEPRILHPLGKGQIKPKILIYRCSERRDGEAVRRYRQGMGKIQSGRLRTQLF